MGYPLVVGIIPFLNESILGSTYFGTISTIMTVIFAVKTRTSPGVPLTFSTPAHFSSLKGCGVYVLMSHVLVVRCGLGLS